jgi:formylmethanofuran dehydrogenase subunit A
MAFKNITFLALLASAFVAVANSSVIIQSEAVATTTTTGIPSIKSTAVFATVTASPLTARAAAPVATSATSVIDYCGGGVDDETTAAPVATVLYQSKYYQCGGINWTGATVCTSGSNCVSMNPYYFQCV